MWQMIIAGAAGAVLASVWLAYWKRIVAWFKRENVAAKAEYLESEAEQKASQLKVFKDQVSAVAQEKEIVLPMSSRGKNPAIVEFSNGNISYYFQNFATYKRMLNEGKAPLRSSYVARAPVPVSHWTRPELERWLDENTR